MSPPVVEVTLTKFRDFVRHFWRLDLNSVNYNIEQDFRLIFDKYLGVEFRFKREDLKKPDEGLEAALKDIWSKNTDPDQTSTVNVPVKVKKEKDESRKREEIKKRKITENVKQEIKTDTEETLTDNNPEKIKKEKDESRNLEKNKRRIMESRMEKKVKLENVTEKVEPDILNTSEKFADSIIDSKVERDVKIEKLDKILIVPKDIRSKVDITQCSLCMFQASSNNTLKVHIEMNHLNLRFHCNICQKNTKEKYVMKDHMKKVHEAENLSNLDFECRRCDLREPFKAFRDHINLFHPDLLIFYPNEPFSKIKAEQIDSKCSFCNFSAPRPNLLNSHVQNTHMNVEYGCRECEFKCKNVIDIRNHTVNSHAPAGVERKSSGASSELRTFLKEIITKKCLACQQNVLYNGDFTRHIKVNHPDNFVQSKKRRKCDIKEEDLGSYYRCEECDYSTKYTSNLSSHVRLIHMATKFTCKGCLFQNNQLANMKRHVRSEHNNKRELISSQCTKCSYSEDSIDLFEFHTRKTHMPNIVFPEGRKKRRYNKSKDGEKKIVRMKKRRGRKAKIVSHDEKPTYNCTECDIVETHDKSNIIEHIFENHEVNENLDEDDQLDDIVKYLKVSCKNCMFQGSFAEYDEHIASNPDKITSKQVNVRCSICASDSTNENDLLLHRLTAHGNAKYVCKVCGFESSQIHVQMRHGKKEHLKPKFRMSCGFCSIKLTRSALEAHLLEKHPIEFNSKNNNKALQKCEECDYQHISDLRIKRHITKVHSTLECPHCGDTFVVRRKMMYHIAINHKIHTFDCQQCEFKTKHESALYRHTISFHTKKKKFKCEVCDKAFSRRDNRDEHTRHCISK